MANFEKYLQALVTNIKDFAAAEFADHVESVVKDGNSFIIKASSINTVICRNLAVIFIIVGDF